MSDEIEVQAQNSDKGTKTNKKKVFKRDLVIFLITFCINSMIVWLLTLSPGEYILTILIGVIPTIGGLVRGSLSNSKHFIVLTFVWAIILSLVYVPLYGSFIDRTVINYSFYIVWGLITAGVMIVASFTPFGIRKLIEWKKYKNTLEKN